MGLDALVRSAVKTARTLTLSLQPAVSIARWTGDNGKGKSSYATPISVKALVVRKQKLITLSDGRQTLSSTYVAILEPLSAQGATGRHEPLDERDVITLSDGTTGPILSITGLVDGSTGKPYYHEVYLG